MYEPKFPYSRRIRNLFSILLAGGLLVGIPLHGVGAEKEPTTITSKTMMANNKKRQAVFKGEVILVQGDLKVKSDVMIVRFKASDHQPSANAKNPEGGGARAVDQIVAKGKVVIEKAKGRATCGYAVYYKDEEKIVLTESPVAWQDGTRVSGPKMTMYLKENRSVVEGGTRVVIAEQEGT